MMLTWYIEVCNAKVSRGCCMDEGQCSGGTRREGETAICWAPPLKRWGLGAQVGLV